MTRDPKRRGRRLRSLMWGAIAIALVATWVGCATNPVTGRREFSLVSPAQELQIGREGHAAVLQEYGVYDDPKLAAYVDSIGQALARVSHEPNLEWHFTVLDDPVVNAFAIPGGYIYITRGILAHLNSEAQLAGVLGHEIGHVTARHSAKQMTQQQLAGLGFGLASVFSEGFRRYSDAAQQALGLLMLKYSRDDETQADELGVEYATRAGWDPREIPNTYVMLRRVGERAGQSLPSFLSTHPDPGDREERTRTLAQQAATGHTGLIIHGRDYVERMDHVVYGADPRQGFFRDTRFVHPQLGFEIQFPAGWKTQNTHAAVVAQEPSKAASMQFTMADAGTLSPEAFVSGLQRDGKISGARGARETVGGWPAWVGRISVTGSDGSESTLEAGFVRQGAEHMFQVLGASADPYDANAAQILESIRSLGPRPAGSPAVEPDRVKVVTVEQNGAFDTVVPTFGTQAVDVEETSILNNVQPDEEVRKGEVLKIVTPGHH
jgi:predicted Zn-dependent protease